MNQSAVLIRIAPQTGHFAIALWRIGTAYYGTVGNAWRTPFYADAEHALSHAVAWARTY